LQASRHATLINLIRGCRLVTQSFSVMMPGRSIKTGTNGPLHRVVQKKKRDEHPRLLEYRRTFSQNWGCRLPYTRHNIANISPLHFIRLFCAFLLVNKRATRDIFFPLRNEFLILLEQIPLKAITRTKFLYEVVRF